MTLGWFPFSGRDQRRARCGTQEDGKQSLSKIHCEWHDVRERRPTDVGQNPPQCAAIVTKILRIPWRMQFRGFRGVPKNSSTILPRSYCTAGGLSWGLCAGIFLSHALTKLKIPTNEEPSRWKNAQSGFPRRKAGRTRLMTCTTTRRKVVCEPYLALVPAGSSSTPTEPTTGYQTQGRFSTELRPAASRGSLRAASRTIRLALDDGQYAGLPPTTVKIA